jgi:hypothetical protein
MRKAALISALVLAVAGAATIAVAQVGGNGEVTPAAEPETHASECAEEATKQSGEFGACVSERASAFGRCVADAAESENGVSPTDECADLKPDNGNGSGANGNGNADGNGNGDNGNGASVSVTPAVASNPTDGVPRPPAEQHGRDFGHQVAGNAGGNPGGNSEGRNPTEEVGSSPQDGRDFGHEVAGNAGGDPGGERRGPPENTPAGP